MTIAEYIFSTLSANVDVIAVFGDRIFPVIAPEGTAAPYCVFQRVVTVPNEAHDGAQPRLDESLYQFTIVGETFTQVEDGENAIRATLEQGTPENGATLIQDSRETFDEEAKLFVRQLDATFFHST